MPVVKSKFHDDIRSMLVTYLKDQQLLKIDQVTPYGYRIDFVLHFDKNRRPVAAPSPSASPHDGGSIVSNSINK